MISDGHPSQSSPICFVNIEPYTQDLEYILEVTPSSPMDHQILLSSTPSEPLRATHTKQCSHTHVILDLDSSPKSSFDLS